jgi:hypothetical protein
MTTQSQSQSICFLDNQDWPRHQISDSECPHCSKGGGSVEVVVKGAPGQLNAVCLAHVSCLSAACKKQFLAWYIKNYEPLDDEQISIEEAEELAILNEEENC